MRGYLFLLLLAAVVLSSGISHGVQISLNLHEVPMQIGYCSDLSPSQIQNAYGFNYLYNSGINGYGQSVAIIVAQGDPTLNSDLATFDSQYGLPPMVNGSNLIISTPFGGSSFNSMNWTIETALDIEVVHSLASQARIYLVIAPNDSWLFNAVNYTIYNLPVQTISISWGASEQDYSNQQIQFINDIFDAAATKHISVFAASGDNGAYNGLSTLNVNFPASSQYVIGVGGTSLSTTSSGGYISETAWSGSGGGYSQMFQKPSPQPNISSYRMVPDVAFNAGTPICAYVNSAWGGYYGTSVAAPSWSAISALVDQKADGSGVVSIKSLYDAYYSVGSISFNPITSGNNGYYYANGGYNLVTGLGTPKVYALAQVLTKASYNISFSSLESGVVFEVNGLNRTAPFSMNFSYGEKVSISSYLPSNNKSIRYAFTSYSGYLNSTNNTSQFFVNGSGSINAAFKLQFAVREININGSENATVFEDTGHNTILSSPLRYSSGGKSYSLVGIRVGNGVISHTDFVDFTVESPMEVEFVWLIGDIVNFTFLGAPSGATATVRYTDYVPLTNGTSTYTSTVDNRGEISSVTGSLLSYSGQYYLSGYRYFIQPATVESSNNVVINFVKEKSYDLNFAAADNSSVYPTLVYVTSRSANGTFNNSTVWAPINEDFTLREVFFDNNGLNVLKNPIQLSPSNYSGIIPLGISTVSVSVKIYLGIPIIGAKVEFIYGNTSISNSTGATGTVTFKNVPDSDYGITIGAYGSGYAYQGLSGSSESFEINPFMYQLYIIVATIALVILVFSLWEVRHRRKRSRL